MYEADPPPDRRERALPTGTVELIFSLDPTPLRVFERGDAQRSRDLQGPLIYGPHSEFFVLDRARHPAIMGVHFKIGGAAALLGLPAGELHNMVVPLEALWGSAAYELRDRLCDARLPAERFRILERALIERLPMLPARHPAVAFALRELMPGSARVADVTDQIGLSGRRFAQLFRDQVGLTPKLFCRIRRFQDVLQQVEQARLPLWADLALSCGYFDQAHFIHDFRAFAGVSPGVYLAQRGHQRNHVVLPDPAPAG
jgi:AraC-like DNA-binding protein